MPSVIPAGIAAEILGRAGRVAQRPCADPGSGGEVSRRRATLERGWQVGFVPGAARVGQAAHGAARLERGRGTRRAESRGTGKKKGKEGEGAPTGGARWQAGGGRAGLDSGVQTGPGLLSAHGWLGRSGGVARSWAEGVEADRAGLGSGFGVFFSISTFSLFSISKPIKV